MHFLPVFLLCTVSWFVLEARVLTSSAILVPIRSHTETFPSVCIRSTHQGGHSYSVSLMKWFARQLEGGFYPEPLGSAIALLSGAAVRQVSLCLMVFSYFR